MLKIAYENLFVLHHNVTGPVWFPTHEQIATYYSMIGDMADDVIEIGMSIGVKEPTIAECINQFTLLTVSDRDEKTTYAETRSIFTGLMTQFQTTEKSLGTGYEDIVNKLQEYRETLRKEADYKLARATNGTTTPGAMARTASGLSSLRRSGSTPRWSPLSRRNSGMSVTRSWMDSTRRGPSRRERPCISLPG
jgi:DNA-binding ferritin-like protein